MQLIRKTRSCIVAGQKKKFGIFVCPQCGNEVERRLQHGKIQNTCGCGKHGGSRDDLYKVWAGMKRRCYNKNEGKYYRYGGRGIEICSGWKDNYLNFKEWAISHGYTKGLQIDRINNNGNYEPSNCRFITNLENARNKENRVLSMQVANAIRRIYCKESLSYSKIGKIFNLDQSLIRQVVLNKIWKNEKESFGNMSTVMALNDYQDLTLKTLEPQCNNLEYLTLGLCGESGEVAEKFKKVIRGDGRIDDEFFLELGDVLFYIARIAGFLNISLSEIAQRNLDKLQSRLDRNVIQGSGDNR